MLMDYYLKHIVVINDMDLILISLLLILHHLLQSDFFNFNIVHYFHTIISDICLLILIIITIIDLITTIIKSNYGMFLDNHLIK